MTPFALFRRALPLGALLIAGCAPRLAPLYRDYRAPDTLALGAAQRALATAGWALAPSPPAGTLATDLRTGSDFGLYRMHLRVEVLPLDSGLVRVLFDPVRRFAWGERSHMPYLPGGLSRTYVAPLEQALKAQGFTPTRTGARKDLGR